MAERWLGLADLLGPDDRLARAEEARKRGEWMEAARFAILAGLQDGGGGKVQQRVDRLRREIEPHLSAAEAACLGGWFGPDQNLELRYVRALYEKGRAGEAQAQALALLARTGAGKRAKEVLELLGRAPEASSLGVAAGATQSVFHVALLAPQSGDYEAYGRSLRAGLALALAEHNAGSALPIRLSSYDTEAEGWRAVREGRRALDAGAGILVGDVLTLPTLVLAGMASERGVPLLSPSATDPMVGAASPNVFQTGASAGEQATALARYATHEKHFTAIAVPATLESSFRAAFEAEATRGWAKVFTLTGATGLRDMRAIAGDLREQGADALLLPAEPVLAELWVAGLAREKVLLPLLATEAIDPQGFRPDTRVLLENMTVVSSDYALPPAVFARVDSLARAWYGVEADRFVRRGYLTGRVIATAIAGGADSPATLTAALRRRSGPLAFVHYEETEATLPILVVRRGALLRAR